MKGVLLRSRARWVGEGEKYIYRKFQVLKREILLVNKWINCGKKWQYFDANERYYWRNKTVLWIYNDNRKTEDCRIEELIKEYPKLAEKGTKNLEGKITAEEATCALKRMKKGKSPGSDGFTVEFLKSFGRRD